MSYKNFNEMNKYPKIDYEQYLDTFQESPKRFKNYTSSKERFEFAEDMHAMRRRFRRIARDIRDSA
jgi:hypothetical protein